MEQHAKAMKRVLLCTLLIACTFGIANAIIRNRSGGATPVDVAFEFFGTVFGVFALLAILAGIGVWAFDVLRLPPTRRTAFNDWRVLLGALVWTALLGATVVSMDKEAPASATVIIASVWLLGTLGFLGTARPLVAIRWLVAGFFSLYATFVLLLPALLPFLVFTEPYARIIGAVVVGALQSRIALRVLPTIQRRIRQFFQIQELPNKEGLEA